MMSAERRQPYVGIAAVATAWQVEECGWYASWLRDTTVRGVRQVLALGFQVSSKTLRGEPNKHPHIFPRVEDLPTLLDASLPSGVERHIHFSPENDADLEEGLERLAWRAGSRLDGVQINLSSPNPDILSRWKKERYPDARLIVAVTPQVLRDCQHQADLLREWFVTRYANVATDVLFDLSGGRGRPLASDEALPYLEAVRDLPGVGVGVAGGLGPVTMEPVFKLLEEGVWPLSWDAQSRLCRSRSGLDLPRVQLYVQVSAALPTIVL